MLEHYLLLLFKLIIGFSCIIIYLYATGKDQPTNNNSIDSIGNYVIGGIIGGIIYNNDITLITYLATLVTALSLIGGLSYASTRFAIAEKVTRGEPLVIVRKGRIELDTFSSDGNRIDMIVIMSKLHAMGISRLDEVEYLQLDPTGELVVSKKGEDLPSVVIYHNGGYITFNLERINVSEEVIQYELDQRKITDVIFIEYWRGEVVVVTKSRTYSISLNAN